MKKSVIVKTREELVELINKTVKVEGLEADLNFIDTSNITDMSELFKDSEFNGRIDQWNVSRVESMSLMFSHSQFNGDISSWDTSSVKNMIGMFFRSSFNQNIGKWNTGSVRDMGGMFNNSKFNQDISKWNTRKLECMRYMFSHSKFNKPIGDWNISRLDGNTLFGILRYCRYKHSLYKWTIQRPDIVFRRYINKNVLRCPFYIRWVDYS
jgi:surface protein